MPTPPEIGAVIAAASVVGGVFVKVLDRYMPSREDQATIDQLNAGAKKTAQETAASEIGYLREIIAEVRSSASEKTTELAALKADMASMKDRMDLMEERERHQLTRAAVHEAWDQLAVQHIMQHGPPGFPPPPPLVVESSLE